MLRRAFLTFNLETIIIRNYSRSVARNPYGIFFSSGTSSTNDRSLVRNSHRNSRPKASNPTNSSPPEYSSSPPSSHEIMESSSRRQKSNRNNPENSVELFFKSLAIEVNRANLPSDRLFNLELCVMKLVSEKIQEYERAEAQMRH